MTTTNIQIAGNEFAAFNQGDFFGVEFDDVRAALGILIMPAGFSTNYRLVSAIVGDKNTAFLDVRDFVRLLSFLAAVNADAKDMLAELTCDNIYNRMEAADEV
jgi:hypothetical protein